MKLSKEEKDQMKENKKEYQEQCIRHPGVSYINTPIYVALCEINDSIKELTEVIKNRK